MVKNGRRDECRPHSFVLMRDKPMPMALRYTDNYTPTNENVKNLKIYPRRTHGNLVNFNRNVGGT